MAFLIVWGVAAVVAVLVLVDPWLEGAGIFTGCADLYVYREGAWRILNDYPLYTEPFLLGLLYTYTPFSTLVFVPLELIPGHWVDQVWAVCNISVLFACVLLSWRLLGYRLTPRLGVLSGFLTATAVFLEPVRTTLFYGQINLVLMLLVLWAFGRRANSPLRGVGIGIAAGIKLTPLYFVAVFLVLGQWRSAAVTVATMLATIAAAWLVLPGESRQYWFDTFFQSTRIADDGHPSNQSLRGVIAHLTGWDAVPLWLWLPLAGAVTAVGLLAARGLHENGEKLLAVTVSGLTAAAVSPFSWSHHWVWFVPLLVYLVHRSLTRPVWLAGAVAVWIAAGSWPYEWNDTNVVIGLFLYPPWWPIMKILMNIYAIVFFVVLAAVVRAGLRRPGDRADTTEGTREGTAEDACEDTAEAEREGAVAGVPVDLPAPATTGTPGPLGDPETAPAGIELVSVVPDPPESDTHRRRRRGPATAAPGMF